jgi:hypothetical protein
MSDQDAHLRVLVDVEGANVLVEPQSGRMFHLNDTGAFVYRLLGKQVPDQEIVRLLCEEYDVEVEEAELDLRRFQAAVRSFLSGAASPADTR